MKELILDVNFHNCSISSSEEVLHILGKILGCLQRGRTCLIVPHKKTVDEIIKSGNMVVTDSDIFFYFDELIN